MHCKMAHVEISDEWIKPFRIDCTRQIWILEFDETKYIIVQSSPALVESENRKVGSIKI